MKIINVVILLLGMAKSQDLDLTKCCPKGQIFDLAQKKCVQIPEEDNLDWALNIDTRPLDQEKNSNVKIGQIFEGCNENQTVLKIIQPLNSDHDEYLSYFENETLLLFGPNHEVYEEFCFDLYYFKVRYFSLSAFGRCKRYCRFI